MDIRLEELGDLTIVRVNDVTNIDAKNAEDVKVRLFAAIESRLRILLDLEPVLFMDSSGLGIILALYRRLKGNNGFLAICNASEPMADVFRMVRLGNMIPIFVTRKEALDKLKPA